MAEDSKIRTKEARSHEIQSSIAQGNMMLNVLRSLPESENVHAFIIRFEELVARLQKCESQCTQNTPEMGAQFDIFRQKQEKMKSLLEQTTQELKSTLADSLDFPGTSQPATENETLRSATECLSQLQAQLISEAETFETLVPSSIASNETVVSSHQVESQVVDTSILSEDVTDGTIPVRSYVMASTPHTTPVSTTTWSSRFAVPIAKLDSLVEDSQKFQSMVERLIDITRRAHLTEATGFLVDISARFVDLRNSFDSLKKSYEEVRDESELPSELRELQLTGFQEFLERLGNNLESTKECFFNIYHLVKADIEHSVTDGSLQILLSDDELAGDEDDRDQPDTTQNTTGLQQSPPTPQQRPDTVPVPAAASAISPPCTPGSKATDSLASQKAYLAALQQQTASERVEIQRLLQQRDQLTERLSTLKTTTLLADSLAQSGAASIGSNDPTDAQDDAKEPATRCQTESVENSPPEQTPMESSEHLPSDTLLSSLSLAHQQQSALLSHLEGKRRELDLLRVQLSALRAAEADANVTTTVNRTGQLINQDEEADDSDRSVDSSRGTTRFSNGVTTLDSRLSERTSTTCSQSSAANTEKLYENMREARILLEQQRDLSASSADAKVLLQRLTGVASVTNSQDRTTMATWGGSSSPVHSSTSTTSAGDEDNTDGMTVNSRIAQQLQLTTVSVGASSLLGFSPTDATTSELNANETPATCRRAAPHHRQKPHTITVVSGSDVSATQQTTSGAQQIVNLAALPQLGHSPSPPSSRQKQSPGYCDRQLGSDLHHGGAIGDQYVYSHSLPTKSAVMASGDVPLSELSYGLINERMQRMEMNIAQLFQVCRCLAVENSSLRSTISQLLPGHINNDILVANPSASNSGIMTPSGGMVAAPHDPFGAVLLMSPHQQPIQRMIPHNGYGVATSQQNAVGGSRLAPRLLESAVPGISGPQMALLQQQQQLLQQQQLQQDLEAQQQVLSRLLMQQQQQVPLPQTPTLPMDRLPRRPLLFPLTGHLISPDVQWLTGALSQPAATSAERLPTRAMTNGFATSHYVPSAAVGAPDAAYNCLLSPQSSLLTGHQSISGSSVTVNTPIGSMLPVVDPAYQMPLSSSALLSRYAGGIM